MKSFKNIRILVVGDIMLDKYRVGEVHRISPEAPVPVVNLKKTYHTLGGCGNVARNIKELGVEVDCLASISHDVYGSHITERLHHFKIGNMLVYQSEQTTVKERIISSTGDVQMLRIDQETTNPIKKIEDMIELVNLNNKYDMIVISDYNKGMITKKLMKFLKSLNIPIIADPKPDNIELFNKIYMITPNLKEWNIIKKNKEYINKISYILVTNGKYGMSLIDQKTTLLKNNRWGSKLDPVFVFNVSGAGDVVIAVMSVCISFGMIPQDAMHIANQCARYSVTNPNTCIIERKIFEEFIDQRYEKNDKI